MKRIDRRLTLKTVGVDGLGCFTITRPFLLSLASAVFTFEIVLLQATSVVSYNVT